MEKFISGDGRGRFGGDSVLDSSFHLGSVQDLRIISIVLFGVMKILWEVISDKLVVVFYFLV